MPRHRYDVTFYFLLCIGATHTTIFPLNYYSSYQRQQGSEGESSSILNFISRFRGGNALSNSTPTKLRHALSENLLTSSCCVEGHSGNLPNDQEYVHSNSKNMKLMNGAQRSGGQVSKLSGGRGFGYPNTAVDEYIGGDNAQSCDENPNTLKFSKPGLPGSLSRYRLNSKVAINSEVEDAFNDTLSRLAWKSKNMFSFEKKTHTKHATNLAFPHYHPIAGLLSTSSSFQLRTSLLKRPMRKIALKNGLSGQRDGSMRTSVIADEIANIAEVEQPEPCVDQGRKASQESMARLIQDVHNESERLTQTTEEATVVQTKIVEPSEKEIIREGGEIEGIVPVQREDSINLTSVEAADLVESVRALCSQGEVESALEVVRTDLRNISHPQCTAVLHEFAMAGRADCAQAALLHMQVVGVEVGVGLDSATYEELLLAYARDEATRSDEGLDQAFSVLDLMTRGGVEADLTAYNRLMEACSAAADSVDTYERGLRLLDIMRERGVKPSVETYNTLLEAVGRRGWSRDNGGGLDRGAALLARMTEDNVSASTDTFNMLMYGCAWAAGAGDGWGGVERGLGFLEAMAEMSAMPDVITFNNLIAACAQVSYLDRNFGISFSHT